jgi:phosphoribosylformylglycinamidine cyclo-ligase
LTRRISYSQAGVDRNLRAESKKALRSLKKTYKFSNFGKILELPYGRLFPFHDRYLDLQIEGVGTKVLIAQLAEKYDTVGIDSVAMVVNDVIRSGAKPLAVVDNIHAQASDPFLVKEWLKGIIKGAKEAECIVPAGEIGDVADLIKGLHFYKGFDMVCGAVGEVVREKIITGRDIKPGDPIIGLRSSGLHSNGISLARRVLFKEWGGKYDHDTVPARWKKSIAVEVLKPTTIYVKPFLRLANEIKVKGAVHITGDAYMKFDRLGKFSPRIGFEFDNFTPQPIFDLIQRTASERGSAIADAEMFKTFNMGWGFAVIVDKGEKDETLDILARTGVISEQMGRVTGSTGVKVFYKGKRIILC